MLKAGELALSPAVDEQQLDKALEVDALHLGVFPRDVRRGRIFQLLFVLFGDERHACVVLL
jgi:hypothetical protein